MRYKTRTLGLACVLVLLAAPCAIADVPIEPFEPTVERTCQVLDPIDAKGRFAVELIGSALMPRARGKAKLDVRRDEIRIVVKVEELEPPERIGHEYLTYVVWNVSDDGLATSLGELSRRKRSGKLETSVPRGPVGLVVTAEPYFAAPHPSDTIVLRAFPGDRAAKRMDSLEVAWGVVPRHAYALGRADEELALLLKAAPGTPSAFEQAQHAIEIARLSEADRFSAQQLKDARSELLAARDLYVRGRRDESIAKARSSVESAESARRAAVVRSQEERDARVELEAARARAQALETELENALRQAEEESRARLEAEKRLDSVLATERQAVPAEPKSDAVAQGVLAELALERARLAGERARLDAAREQATFPKAVKATEVPTETLQPKASTPDMQEQLFQARADAERARLETEVARERAALDVEKAQLEAERRILEIERASGLRLPVAPVAGEEQPESGPQKQSSSEPAPVLPQPAPVAPQPAPVAPQPAPVAPQPAPAAPQPAPAAAEPVAQARTLAPVPTKVVSTPSTAPPAAIPPEQVRLEEEIAARERRLAEEQVALQERERAIAQEETRLEEERAAREEAAREQATAEAEESKRPRWWPFGKKNAEEKDQAAKAEADAAAEAAAQPTPVEAERAASLAAERAEIERHRRELDRELLEVQSLRQRLSSEVAALERARLGLAPAPGFVEPGSTTTVMVPGGGVQADLLAAEQRRLALQQQELDAMAQRLRAERSQVERDKLQIEYARKEAQLELERKRLEADRSAFEAERRTAEAPPERTVSATPDVRTKPAEVAELLGGESTERGVLFRLAEGFDTGKASLRADARERLARYAGVLSTLPNVDVTIEGFTDSMGDEAANQDLSERRAMAVLNFLRERGVPASAMTSRGFGEQRPIATNETAEGRSRNRRVEVIVSQKAGNAMPVPTDRSSDRSAEQPGGVR